MNPRQNYYHADGELHKVMGMWIGTQSMLCLFAHVPPSNLDGLHSDQIIENTSFTEILGYDEKLVQCWSFIVAHATIEVIDEGKKGFSTPF